jgi:hypothetical protein
MKTTVALFCLALSTAAAADNARFTVLAFAGELVPENAALRVSPVRIYTKIQHCNFKTARP